MYNEELVEQVRQRNLIIKNDGTFNELKNLLKHCFPNDRFFDKYPASLRSHHKYFYASTAVADGWSSTNDRAGLIQNYKSVKEFIKEEFVLPAKWCIKRDLDNWKIVVDYLNSLGAAYTYDNYSCPYVCNYEGENNSNDHPHKGYTEITFEQFKKYVLKQKTMKGKEIIGWKAPCNMYGDRVVKGTIFVKTNGNCCRPESYQEGDYCPFLIPNEIVETWEPAYKSNEVKIRMGGSFDLVVKDGKVWHSNEEITGYVTSIGNMYKNTNLNQPACFGPYPFNVKDMVISKTGCRNVETKLSEWLAVYDELVKQQF